MKMSKKSMLSEHKELLKVLKHPTKKSLQKEIREQGEEYRRMKKTGK